jgi:organic hydroperoxide reductase OsmC/OhrA
LSVAAASGCLMTTFLAIAEKDTLDFISFSCKAKGKFERLDGKFMISEIFLYPEVVVHGEAHQNQVIRILKKAEVACLINHSISSEIIKDANI